MCREAQRDISHLTIVSNSVFFVVTIESGCPTGSSIGKWIVGGIVYEVGLLQKSFGRTPSRCGVIIHEGGKTRLGTCFPNCPFTRDYYLTKNI